jgi:hypothetical protein
LRQSSRCFRLSPAARVGLLSPAPTAFFVGAATAGPVVAACAPGSSKDHIASQLNAQELNRVTHKYPLYGPSDGLPAAVRRLLGATVLSAATAMLSTARLVSAAVTAGPLGRLYHPLEAFVALA